MKEAAGNSNNNPETRRSSLDAREYLLKGKGLRPLQLPEGTKVDVSVLSNDQEDPFAAYIESVQMPKGVEVYLSGTGGKIDAEFPDNATFALTSEEKRAARVAYNKAQELNFLIEQREASDLKQEFQKGVDREIADELDITLKPEPEQEIRDAAEGAVERIGGTILPLSIFSYNKEELEELKGREDKIDQDLALGFIRDTGIEDKLTINPASIRTIQLYTDLSAPKDSEK